MKNSFLIAVLGLCLAAPAFAGETQAGPAPEASLERLLEGNQRFVKGAPQHPGETPERRAELTAGQKPFAAVLTCADSRVPPELLFDQGLGDIFTVRVAGNVADQTEQGSLEYAAEHLGVPLIMVLGHTSCGAVKAAAAGGKAEGYLASVLKDIEPSVKAVKARGVKGDDVAPAVVEENVRQNALALLRKNAVIKKLAAEGKVRVSAAVYDLASGQVRLLDLDQDLKAERKARVAAVRELVRKLRAGALDDSERGRLLAGLGELMPELN